MCELKKKHEGRFYTPCFKFEVFLNEFRATTSVDVP